MTKSVVMLANVFDADRVLLAAGSTVSVADSVADDLIGTGRARWLVPPVSNPATPTKEEVEAARSVTDLVYATGLLTNYNAAGSAYSVTYDANNRVSTVTGGGVTRTATYNSDGTLASWA